MSISSIDTIPAVSITVYVLDERLTVGIPSICVRERGREGRREGGREGEEERLVNLSYCS